MATLALGLAAPLAAAEPESPPAPEALQGAWQADHVSLTWQAPTAEPGVQYRVYEDGLLVAQVRDTGYVASANASVYEVTTLYQGQESEPATLSEPGESGNSPGSNESGPCSMYEGPPVPTVGYDNDMLDPGGRVPVQDDCESESCEVVTVTGPEAEHPYMDASINPECLDSILDYGLQIT